MATGRRNGATMLELPAQRPGYRAPADLLARRAGLDAAVVAGLWHTDPAPEALFIGGVRCLRWTPTMPSRGTIMHLHGGAFRIGCPEQVGLFAAALALRCNVDVICPAYRLAPEHPFPAGLNDAWAVVHALAGATPLVISGDSAGGGLAASVAALAGQNAIRLEGLALLSPWLDLTVTNDSYAVNAASDPLFSADAAQTAANQYLQGYSSRDPLVSPSLGPVAQFPPVYVNVGMGEVLADDARHLHARLCEAGVPVRLHVIDGMDHVALTRGATLPGSEEAMAGLVAFVDRVLRLDGPHPSD